MASGKLAGQFLTESGWLEGELAWDDAGIISQVEGQSLAAADARWPHTVAGFIDLHVHGGGGYDAMEGAQAVRGMSEFHAQSGTVALAPTTMTAPVEQISDALSAIEQVRGAPQAGAPLVIGAHLEGPFISPQRVGAQPPDYLLEPDTEIVQRWLGSARLPIATLAPELAGGMELVRQLAGAGCRVQIGHSNATLEQASAALEAGVSGFTHLYNAMSPLVARDPGVVGCALAAAQYAEVICDLQHVHEGALRTALRAIPQLYAITDATAAAGSGEGKHRLGMQQVVKQGATVRTLAGELAGTAMTMWDARKLLLGIGIDEQLVQEMVSGRPARYLGFDKLGSIAVGKIASLVTISGDGISQVRISGILVE